MHTPHYYPHRNIYILSFPQFPLNFLLYCRNWYNNSKHQGTLWGQPWHVIALHQSWSHSAQAVNRWGQKSNMPGLLTVMHHFYHWCVMLGSSQNLFFTWFWAIDCPWSYLKRIGKFLDAGQPPCCAICIAHRWWETPGEPKEGSDVSPLFPDTQPSSLSNHSPAVPRSHTRASSAQEPQSKSTELLSPWQWRSPVSGGLITQWWSQILTVTGVLPWLWRYSMNIRVLPLHHCFPGFWLPSSSFFLFS